MMEIHIKDIKEGNRQFDSVFIHCKMVGDTTDKELRGRKKLIYDNVNEIAKSIGGIDMTLHVSED